MQPTSLDVMPTAPRADARDAPAAPAKRSRVIRSPLGRALGGQSMRPTPYADLNGVLTELVVGVEPVLGESFVGAYLQGSFAGGGFDEHSDADFVVVSERELSDRQVAALQGVHERVYELDCEWAKHLEGSYFPKPVLRTSEGRGVLLWYLNHGSKVLERSKHCNTIVVRWVLREHGVVLAGPSPAVLVEPIPVAELRKEIHEEMMDWGREILTSPDRFRNRFYQSFIVLSYAKMLHDLRAGRIGSKREGTEWAKGVLDPSWADLIDRAWDGRPNPAKSVREPPDEADFERTLEFVNYVIGQIARPN